MALKKTARILRKHTHPRIQMQFALFTIIAVIMFGIVVYDVVSQGVSLWWVIGAAVVGIIIGYAIGWAFKIRWHNDTKRVIQNTDKVGLLLIGIYVVIRVGGQQALSTYVHGNVLAAVLYSVIAGIMVGRVISLGRRVNSVLKSKKLI